MVALHVNKFSGMAPRLGKRQLAAYQAQKAQNCLLLAGELRPLAAALQVASVTRGSQVQSIYRYGADTVSDTNYWLSWTTDVDVVRSPIFGDTAERIYWTGDGAPKVSDNSIILTGGGSSYPNNSYQLGLPAPAAAPSTSIASTTGGRTVASLTRSGNTVTVNLAAHGFKTQDPVLINGATPNGYNGVFPVTVTDADHFTYDVTDATLAAASGSITAQLSPVDSSETIVWIYAYVSAWGEEGPTSLPSAPLTGVPAVQDFTVSGFSAVPSGNYNISKIRLYRTNTGASGAQYQFVDEFAVGTASYTDSKQDTDLGEVCPSIDWIAPPTDLKGLVAHPSGFLAGFSGKDLYCSEIAAPHAWPVKYRYTMQYAIVALAVYGNNILVCTTGPTYVATGTAPESLAVVKLPLLQACQSKRSIAVLGQGVAYAGPDGLIGVTPSGADILTRGSISREDWQALKPATMHAAAWNNQYLLFYDCGAGTLSCQGDLNGQPGKGCLLIDPVEGSITVTDDYFMAAYLDPIQDALYLVDTANNISRWMGGSPKTFDWVSKEFVTGHPVNMGRAQVYAAAYPVTFKLMADCGSEGVKTYSVAVQNASPFPLPANIVSQFFTIELSGTQTIYQVDVAENVRGLLAV